MLLGTMHHVNTAQATGLCHAARASPGEVHTQIQSRPVPPDCSLEPRCPGGGRAGSSDWCLHGPGPRWGCSSSAPPPPPSSFVCELLTPAPLPCPAAALPAAHGGGLWPQPQHLWPQRAACPRWMLSAGSQGRRVFPPWPCPLQELVWVTHWERVLLAGAPEPGVAIGGSHRARLVWAAGRWRPHKGIVCRGKRGFCLLLETGQREEQFPPFITNSPI